MLGYVFIPHAAHNVTMRGMGRRIVRRATRICRRCCSPPLCRRSVRRRRTKFSVQRLSEARSGMDVPACAEHARLRHCCAERHRWSPICRDNDL